MAHSKLNQAQVNIVVRLISGWPDKLTWALLVLRVQDITGVEITRQALEKYEVVKDSYQKRKEILRNPKVLSQEGRCLSDGTLSKRILSLEAQLEASEKQVATLQGFIADLVDEAKEIPDLLNVFRRVKRNRVSEK
ncbi:hypothetical protein [Vibrio cyclitrophicus]|uniref:hypothetical protein n=1 Tax=Vibrio cyclitrophicus TaxID=47951 RepID=UPI0011B68962|nr:hypothetical protein [Vibrio cyclitrophicus]